MAKSGKYGLHGMLSGLYLLTLSMLAGLIGSLAARVGPHLQFSRKAGTFPVFFF